MTGEVRGRRRGTDRPIWVYMILPTLISLQLYHLSFPFNSSISLRSDIIYLILAERQQPPARATKCATIHVFLRALLLALVSIYNLYKLAYDSICETSARVSSICERYHFLKAMYRSNLIDRGQSRALHDSPVPNTRSLVFALWETRRPGRR